MSDLPALFLAAVFTVAVVGAAVHKLRHACRRAEVALAPPLIGFHRRGTNTLLHDTCALIWDLPAYGETPDAGEQRLLQAIRDEQQKEDRP
ncbi:hypothetical protein [Streptomyces sp. NPDC053367]|uniref:hypothetical protein n=1 Tax=Streptomyces sp. NPDC053367 TaxID=3365700 RepID=UPI0037CF0BF4